MFYDYPAIKIIPNRAQRTATTCRSGDPGTGPQTAYTLLHQRPDTVDHDGIAPWIEERPAHDIEADSVAYELLTI